MKTKYLELADVLNDPELRQGLADGLARVARAGQTPFVVRTSGGRVVRFKATPLTRKGKRLARTKPAVTIS